MSVPNDSVFTRLALTYVGEKLASLERQRLLSGTFVVNKTMAVFLLPRRQPGEAHRALPGDRGLQPEATTFDRFEQYDGKINVDGFGLLHDEFFDHLVLLPGVQLQKGTRRGSPTRETATTTRSTTSTATTAWTVLSPLRETFVYLTGPDAGKHFQTRSVFTYY